MDKTDESGTGARRARITAERLLEMAERQMRTLDNPGICLSCGAEAEDCEPDARERVEKSYSWRAIAQQTLALYQRLCRLG